MGDAYEMLRTAWRRDDAEALGRYYGHRPCKHSGGIPLRGAAEHARRGGGRIAPASVAPPVIDHRAISALVAASPFATLGEHIAAEINLINHTNHADRTQEATHG